MKGRYTVTDPVTGLGLTAGQAAVLAVVRSRPDGPTMTVRQIADVLGWGHDDCIGGGRVRHHRATLIRRDIPFVGDPPGDAPMKRMAPTCDSDLQPLESRILAAVRSDPTLAVEHRRLGKLVGCHGRDARLVLCRLHGFGLIPDRPKAEPPIPHPSRPILTRVDWDRFLAYCRSIPDDEVPIPYPEAGVKLGLTPGQVRYRAKRLACLGHPEADRLCHSTSNGRHGTRGIDAWHLDDPPRSAVAELNERKLLIRRPVSA